MTTNTRRHFLAAAAGLPAAATAWSSQVPGAAAKRPNILFLLADDQRWDTLGCMGNKIIRTPNIDRIAAQGVTFRNNFVSTAICMTSRACIFSGLLERSHGISSFSQPFSPEARARTYPAVLRRNGYRTGFIGKYGLGGELPSKEFDYFTGFSGQGKYFQEYKGKTTHLETILGDQSLEFLGGSSADQPFCLSVSFKAPHVQDEDPRQFLYDPVYESLYKDDIIPVPETASETYFDKLPKFIQNSEGRRRWQMRFSNPELYQRSVKGYYRLITGIDVQVGRMLKLLEEREMLDNTVIVYTGDNGFYLGEHGLAGKWLMHEESIRTPLIIRDPRLPASARGKRRDEMSLNIDVAPTMLSAAGLDVPPSVQGRDLMPLVRGDKPAWRREFFYSHLFKHATIPKNEGVRDGRWKYSRYIDSEPLYEHLFDLKNDPREKNDLARSGEHAGQLQAMRDRWRIWREAIEGWSPQKPWKDPAPGAA